jgi:hypothetical protein
VQKQQYLYKYLVARIANFSSTKRPCKMSPLNRPQNVPDEERAAIEVRGADQVHAEGARQRPEERGLQGLCGATSHFVHIF